MNKPYAIRSYSSPLDGEDFEEDFTHMAGRVRVSRKMMGGDWILEFSIPLAARGRTYLRDWFDSRLFHTIRMFAGGGKVWEGVVWQLDLSLDGIKLRRDYGEVFNSIKAHYTDEGGTQSATAFFDDVASQSQFGVREQVLYLREMPTAVAEAEAQTALIEMADAWPRTVAASLDLDNRLDVIVCGKVFTANNRYVSPTTLDNLAGNIDVFVTNIITNDCEFLTAGEITTNALQKTRSLDTAIRAWDYLAELTEAGDGTNPFVLSVNPDAFMDYHVPDNTPIYFWHGRRDGFQGAGGVSPPSFSWAAGPGVMRDVTRPNAPAIPGSFLASINDSWILETEMADGQAFPELKPEGLDDEELLRSMRQYGTFLEEEEENG